MEMLKLRTLYDKLIRISGLRPIELTLFIAYIAMKK
jgi:hypothetical protein